jgi:hypothetical protein
VADRPHQAQSRMPVWVNGVFAGTLVTIIAALAVVAPPPAPPSIAEFAPQATKSIDKPPPRQSSEFGVGAGGLCLGGQACARGVGAQGTTGVARPMASTQPSLPPVAGAPSALQCYVWPDGSVTQTWDPQSPPCIASWPQADGNGGSTSRGVTTSEIRVALPYTQLPPNGPAIIPATAKAYENFFNSRFQFYGRKLRILPFESAQFALHKTDPEGQAADARTVAELKPFAALGYQHVASQATFVSNVARAGVVASVAGGSDALDSAAALDAATPLSWRYHHTIDELLSAVGDLSCRQLVGKTAGHSQTTATQRRKFAALLPSASMTGTGGLPSQSLKRAFDRCGVQLELAEYGRDEAYNSATVLDLQQAGVTTIVYVPWTGAGGQSTPMRQATLQQYFPEWVVAAWEMELVAELGVNPEQTSHAYGVIGTNKLLAVNSRPAYRAHHEGGGTTSQYTVRDADGMYHDLLVLASGIQMAGPRLTPETMDAALHRTNFPNPGAAAAPAFQATVGFINKSIMISDFGLFWYDEKHPFDVVDTYDGFSSNFCYVDRGGRWAPSAFPLQDRFFQGTCR